MRGSKRAWLRRSVLLLPYPTQALEKRITAAMREAHSKSVEGMKEKMRGLAAKLGLPGALPS